MDEVAKGMHHHRGGMRLARSTPFLPLTTSLPGTNPARSVQSTLIRGGVMQEVAKGMDHHLGDMLVQRAACSFLETFAVLPPPIIRLCFLTTNLRAMLFN